MRFVLFRVVLWKLKPIIAQPSVGETSADQHYATYFQTNTEISIAANLASLRTTQTQQNAAKFASLQ